MSKKTVDNSYAAKVYIPLKMPSHITRQTKYYDYMKKVFLTENQLSAVSHDKGPALVIAGPGSGKTTVIIERLLKLASKYKEASFLSLTFSVAAAAEMKLRFAKGVAACSASPAEKASMIERILFSTVHSLAYEILRFSGKHTNATVLDGDMQRDLIVRLCRDINNENLPSEDTEKLLNFISRIRNNPEEAESLRSHAQIRNYERIEDAYEKRKSDANLIDYEDMIIRATELMKSDRKVYDTYSRRYDFIQIDEAQDLTAMQFEFLGLLSPDKNIFVVADDDQTIYGFRGASPRNLMNFVKDMPDCTRYRLLENHRCCKDIVAFSSALIRENKDRIDKVLTSSKKEKGQIELVHLKDSYTLGKFIAYETAGADGKNTTGILYRNNRSSVAPTLALLVQDIPFHISGAFSPDIAEYINLFEMLCVKDGLTPKAFLHGTGCENFIKLCLERNTLYRKDSDNILLAADLVIQISKYVSSIRDFQELTAKLLHSLEAGGHSVKNKSCNVFLSTIHSAKGLEYDTVFLINLNRGEFPGKSSEHGVLLDEERRLFYVGITRAKSRLNISYSENYAGRKSEESVLFREALSKQTEIRRKLHKSEAE